jgi:hypothetical protein
MVFAGMALMDGALGAGTLTANRAAGANVIPREPANAEAGAVELSTTGRCAFFAGDGSVWSCSAASVEGAANASAIEESCKDAALCGDPVFSGDEFCLGWAASSVGRANVAVSCARF